MIPPFEFCFAQPPRCKLSERRSLVSATVHKRVRQVCPLISMWVFFDWKLIYVRMFVRTVSSELMQASTALLTLAADKAFELWPWQSRRMVWTSWSFFASFFKEALTFKSNSEKSVILLAMFSIVDSYADLICVNGEWKEKVREFFEERWHLTCFVSVASADHVVVIRSTMFKQGTSIFNDMAARRISLTMTTLT